MKNLFYLLLCISTATAQEFDAAAVQRFQQEQNVAFADSTTSPLTREDRLHFKGLDFYAPDAKYYVTAQFRRSKHQKPFGMKTSTVRLPLYVKYGELIFTIDGKKLRLNVYQSVDLVKNKAYKDDLFLPFSDLTNGGETYIGGRYIDLKIPQGNTIAVDFNQAYNPYCAYNHKYSCPAVPLENDLEIAIKAGVKKFHD